MTPQSQRGGVQGFCDDNIKNKKHADGGGMSKIVQNCVTLFMDDPYHKIDIKILIILENPLMLLFLKNERKNPQPHFKINNCLQN